jgi:nucleoside-diphosphate-sugar epimerase
MALNREQPLTYLVTGGTGFIGRRLLALSEGDHVLAAGRSGLSIAGTTVDASTFDLADAEKYRHLFANHNPDVLVHLAWQGLPDYSAENSLYNLIVGLRLIDCATKEGVRRIVVAGSGWEYGTRKGPLREDDTPESPSVFAAHKLAQFNAADALCRERGVELVWLRIFFSYGPGQRQQSLVPSVVESLRRGEVPVLRTPGALSDFIYVDDVARVVRAVLQPGGPMGIINVGTGRATAAFEVARLVAEVMESKVRIPDAETIDGPWADTTRLCGEVGFTPRVSLESGIQRTVRSILGDSHA